MNNREKAALKALCTDKWMRPDEIEGVGHVTLHRLAERGFVEYNPELRCYRLPPKREAREARSEGGAEDFLRNLFFERPHREEKRPAVAIDLHQVNPRRAEPTPKLSPDGDPDAERLPPGGGGACIGAPQSYMKCRVDRATLLRLKRACYWTGMAFRHQIENLIRMRAEELERDHNNGKPFTAIPRPGRLN